uniref:SEFIR domain-containing protein n=1 Tax=Oncorhynchus tshawytscha TaxID=74940 RepID=A0A8C8LSB2_ONCTS
MIIVVISPKYKADVERDGEDEHGLHTKFSVMLIPSLSSRDMFILLLYSPECNDSAYPMFLLQRYVPAWLQSTRIHHWPQDTQDLLLRLLLEERYIGPPLGKELTLSVRHL